ncbi:CDP-alcohol phosphatidyltransferase family protein [Terrisporobacter sp.]
MINIKYIPNLITCFRIFASLILFTTEPFSELFYLIYFLCGVSDVLDGYIARKTNSTSKLGQVLDSIGDMIFIFVVFTMILPILKFPFWILLWIGLIFIIRTMSLLIGFIKYNSLASLHTYANKFAGLALFFFPFLYDLSGLLISTYITCTIANISALEELIINIKSKNLNRDIKFLFKL